MTIQKPDGPDFGSLLITLAPGINFSKDGAVGIRFCFTFDWKYYYDIGPQVSTKICFCQTFWKKVQKSTANGKNCNFYSFEKSTPGLS